MLVVSANAINQQPLVVTVVVGTAASNIRRDYPANVRLLARESGLPIDTVFLCFQVRSIDPAHFRDPRTGKVEAAGAVPPDRMEEIEAALRRVLELG